MKHTLTILAFAFLVSCSSTKMMSSWKEPSSSAAHLDKVLVTVLATNESSRRIAEDKLSEKNEKLFPSYQFFANAETVNDEEKTKAVFADNGFDGVMMVKLLEQKEEETYVPGTTYYPPYRGYGYWGYHSAYWGAYYQPGYYTTNKKYIIETSVFSVEEDKLVWSGITSTVNPSQVERTIDEVAYLTYKQMLKDGFVSKSK